MESTEGRELFFSVVIPARDASRTIGMCIEAAFGSRYGNFEVVVVDDGSMDGTAEIVQETRARLVRLKEPSGVSAARNRGAAMSEGEALFFTDSDCLIDDGALSAANRALLRDRGAVVGGTYTALPYDGDFFSAFQSAFISYSETKNPVPDYVATHALVVDAGVFAESGRFREDFLPILEDVELSHRMRRSGVRLVMEPEIRVTHIFNFNLFRSIKNALIKSYYWTIYSIKNGDLAADSGTASSELKWSALALLSSAVLATVAVAISKFALLLLIVPAQCANLYMSRRFIAYMKKTKGAGFAALGALYFMTLYALAAGLGGLMGALASPFAGLKLR